MLCLDVRHGWSAGLVQVEPDGLSEVAAWAIGPHDVAGRLDDDVVSPWLVDHLFVAASALTEHRIDADGAGDRRRRGSRRPDSSGDSRIRSSLGAVPGHRRRRLVRDRGRRGHAWPFGWPTSIGRCSRPCTLRTGRQRSRAAGDAHRRRGARPVSLDDTSHVRTWDPTMVRPCTSTSTSNTVVPRTRTQSNIDSSCARICCASGASTRPWWSRSNSAPMACCRSGRPRHGDSSGSRARWASRFLGSQPNRHATRGNAASESLESFSSPSKLAALSAGQKSSTRVPFGVDVLDLEHRLVLFDEHRVAGAFVEGVAFLVQCPVRELSHRPLE